MLDSANMSHPVWVRGLKQANKGSGVEGSRSHPVWVRGLKRTCTLVITKVLQVAPRVGAWIETFFDC